MFKKGWKRLLYKYSVVICSKQPKMILLVAAVMKRTTSRFLTEQERVYLGDSIIRATKEKIFKHLLPNDIARVIRSLRAELPKTGEVHGKKEEIEKNLKMLEDAAEILKMNGELDAIHINALYRSLKVLQRNLK